MIYRFDQFEIDSERYEVRRDGAVIKVEPQVFAILELLAANQGRLVSKEDLNERIWGGRVVSEGVVNSRIRSARQALGDSGQAQRMIETVRGRGFRLSKSLDVAVVYPDHQPAPVPEPSAGVEETMDSAPSIAILPFQLLGGEGRHAMMADALAHEAIVALSRLPWLTVIARGSSFKFRGPDVDLQAAGKVLGARYFLTGALTIESPRTLVTAELWRADNLELLWAERYEGKLDDLLTLPRTIAQQIATSLDIRIPVLEASRAAHIPTENLDSWTAYHRGLWHMYRFNAHDNEIATQMFQRAISGDPNFARAYAGLSFTHFQNVFVGFTKDLETDQRLTLEYADKGMELGPFDPFTNLNKGRAHMLAGDLQAAGSWLDRCVELNPNYAFAIYNRGWLKTMWGLGAEGEASQELALRLSPIEPLRYAMLASRGLSHVVRRNFAKAAEWAEQGTHAPNAHVHISMIAAVTNDLAGNPSAAGQWADNVRGKSPKYRQTDFFRAFPFQDSATRDEISGAIRRLGFPI